jgi:TPR repeat protein
MKHRRRIGTFAAAVLALGGSSVMASPGMEAWASTYQAALDAWRQGEVEVAERELHESLRQVREAGDEPGERRVMRGLEKVWERLESDLSREAALARLESGDPDLAAASLGALARHAEAGDGEAARVLGALHIEGHLARPDMEVGLAWVDRAIAAEDVAAMVYKAELLERGLGVPLDLGAARKLYRRAAKAGHGISAYRLGKALVERGVLKEAERWLRLAAEQGLSTAQVDLGALLYTARDRDEEAADWFHRAALEGDPEGRFNLGLCVLEGRGQIADRRLATEYFRQAAEGGSRAAREALLALGELPASEPQTD